MSQHTDIAIPAESDRRDATVRIIALIIMVLAMGWVAIALFQGHTRVAIAAGLAASGSFAAVILLDRQRSILAKLVWISSVVTAICSGAFLIHPDGHVAVLYGAMAGTPLIAFSRDRERGILIGSMLFVSGTWLAQRLLGYDFFGAPEVGQAIAQRVYAPMSEVTALCLIIAEIFYFDSLSATWRNRMRDAVDAAEKANRAKSNLLASMSHEIRTPMNGVLGMVELVQNSELTSEQRRMMATVRDSSVALLRIIDDILDVSKAEAGKLALSPEPTQLLPLIEGVTDTLQPIAAKMNVSLGQIIDPTLPECLTLDGDRLRQILLNLLGNAIKFSERAANDDSIAMVVLKVYRKQDVLQLTVTDNGIGMDEEMLSKLFGQYVQSGAIGARRFGGTGLGLAIVQQLVRQMHGTIQVTSTPRVGTTVEVELPIVAPTGHLEAPDLTGKDVVIYFSSEARRAVAEHSVAPTKARLYSAQSAEDFLEAAERFGSGAIYVIGKESCPRVNDEAFLLQFQRAYPQARHVSFSARPSDRFGPVSTTHQRIQWSPMKLSDFWLALDRAAKPSPLLPHTATTDSTPIAAGPNLSKEPTQTILVVEDNEINRQVISGQLKALGYYSAIACDGAEGLAMWEEFSFPLIVTDCHMPNMDGFEMAARIREIERREGRPRTSIIAVTANAPQDERERSQSVEVDVLLSKPLTLAQLKEAIDMWR